MIDERQEEQASLYALGAMSTEEAAAFEVELRHNPELQQLVASLRNATRAMAGTVPQVVPPPGLKQKILDQIDSREKIVPLVQPARTVSPFVWLPWALAACFAILCAVMEVRDGSLRGEASALAKQRDELRHDADQLKQELIAVNEKYQAANLRVALLDSLLTDSKAAAVAVWDGDSQNGMFLAKNLKPLPQDRDYELWVFDGDKPVAAGLLSVDAQGNARMQIKAQANVQSAKQFAVTDEPKGGGPVPRGKAVLAGG